MTKPRVLISDALSPAAVQIFKDRGVEVDFQPNLGKDKDKLAEIIGNYDGLAIRSATKATAKIIEKATRLKVIGRAGVGVDNVESGGDREGHPRHQHAAGQRGRRGRAGHRPDVRAGARKSAGRGPTHRHLGEEEVHGRRDRRQDAGRDRLRQHRRVAAERASA